MSIGTHDGGATTERGTSAAADGPQGSSPGLARVVLFTSECSYLVGKTVATLVRSFPAITWTVVVAGPERSARRRLRNQLVHLHRDGLRWIPYVFRELGQRVRDRRSSRAATAGMPGSQYSPEALSQLPQVTLRTFASIHADKVFELVRDFAPDLGLSIGAPILRPRLFSIPRLGTINLHEGRLPDYRGMPPAFWELVNGETSVGCTINRVDAGIDTGAVLLASAVPRLPHSTVRGLQISLDELGVRLVREAVGQLHEGAARWAPQPPGGRTYTRPSLRQEADLARRLATPSGERALRRVLKQLLFFGYVRIRALQRLWLGLVGRQRIVVLLYHRVNDDMRDTVTVGLEQFERHMRWLHEHCRVVRIEDAAAGRVARRGSRPIVVVTFDDGYADNYHFAAPILERWRVPAAFFVSTARIGTSIGFEHDLQRKGEVVPTMSWGEVAELAARGFSIGSHTATHIDCGREDLDVVRRELVESRAELARRLGLREIAFAYPFGRRDNITPAARALVREVGYLACLSAYGGCNSGRIDPDNVLRTAMHHNFSFAAFRARVEGFG